MDTSKVCFQYKGSRDYIHGTDMFNHFMSMFPGKEISHIRFSVHDFVRDVSSHVYKSTCKKDIDELSGVSTRCQLEANGEPYWIGLKPVADDALEGRYEYDEDSLVQQCALDGEVLTLDGLSPYTFIETVVAMNKHLLQSLFPDAGGKWVFTRIDLPAHVQMTSKLSVKFKHNMNFRLLKSDILVEGEKVGDLYFSLVK